MARQFQDPFGFLGAINWDAVDEHADEIAAIFEDDSLLDSEMKALGWPPYDLEEDDLPDPNVDCGHCITPEDRCSDISDRNCMGRH